MRLMTAWVPSDTNPAGSSTVGPDLHQAPVSLIGSAPAAALASPPLPREVQLRGITEPVEIVTVDWR